MRHSLPIAMILCGACAAHAAEPSSLDRYSAELLKPYVPAVSMETDRRVAPTRAIGTGTDATGLIRCGGAVGTAQLTLRNDLITTAAHVLIGEGGEPRKGCMFQSLARGAAVAIDTASIKTGSRTPMSEPATRDWAVARLKQPVAGVTPYGLAAAGIKPSGVFMIAGGNKRAHAMGATRAACLQHRQMAYANLQSTVTPRQEALVPQ